MRNFIKQTKITKMTKMTKTEMYELTMTNQTLQNLIDECQDYYKKNNYPKNLKSVIDRLKVFNSLKNGIPKHYDTSIDLNGIQLETLNKVTLNKDFTFSNQF